MTACQAVLGCAQWLAAQTMPQISVHVSMLSAMLPDALVKDLGRINALVRTIKECAHVGLRIRPIRDPAW
eukprot:7607388-Alexandrium_andersonii.AAC.1